MALMSIIGPSDPPITSLLDFINSLPPIDQEEEDVPIPHHQSAIVMFQQQQEADADNCELELSLSSTIASASSSSSNKRKATTHYKDRPRGPKRSKNKNTELLDPQVSTELTLSPPDPFVIKKTLETSDVNTLARLMLSKEAMEKHVLPYWDEDTKERIRLDKKGVAVKVWDMDEEREHHMKMRLWGDNKSYVLNDKWISKIVRNRMLKKGDQIGLCWDGLDSRLVFSVLHRYQLQKQQYPLHATPITFCAPQHHC